MKFRIGLPGCALLFLASGVARAAVLPPGFGESVVAGDIPSPTAMDFAPDGRLFAGIDRSVPGSSHLWTSAWPSANERLHP